MSDAQQTPEPGAQNPGEEGPELVETVTQEDVLVRSTPRYWRFMLLGAIVFAIVALVVTYSRPEQAGYDRNVVFGFVLLVAVAVGIALGAVAALIAERITRRTERGYLAERITTSERER